jgi:hypothetical protein
MNNFYIGLITTVVIIVLLEVFRFLEKRLIGALTLVGIPFIYIGFSWNDTASLIFSIAGVAVFVALSYFGYKNNFYPYHNRFDSTRILGFIISAF